MTISSSPRLVRRIGLVAFVTIMWGASYALTSPRGEWLPGLLVAAMGAVLVWKAWSLKRARLTLTGDSILVGSRHFQLDEIRQIRKVPAPRRVLSGSGLGNWIYHLRFANRSLVLLGASYPGLDAWVEQLAQQTKLQIEMAG